MVVTVFTCTPLYVSILIFANIRKHLKTPGLPADQRATNARTPCGSPPLGDPDEWEHHGGDKGNESRKGCAAMRSAMRIFIVPPSVATVGCF